jgi:hypothetical protein
MSAASCADCGGTLTPVYAWSNPVWKRGTWANLTWSPVNWESQNSWVPTIDMSALQILVQQAAGLIIGREIMQDFNSRFNLFTTVFNLVACDCTNTGNAYCFGGNGTSSIISSPVSSCIIDPSTDNSCGDGAITLDAGAFGNGTAPTVEVNLISSASYLQSKNTVLRRAVGNSANYAIVTYIGAVVGQIIGNGKQIIFSSSPSTAVTICLDEDLNINQDLVSYSAYDFVNGTSGSLGEPMGLTVSKNGTSYCADVTPFTSAVLVPILRYANYLSYGNADAASTAKGNGVTAAYGASTSLPTKPAVSPATSPPAGSAAKGYSRITEYIVAIAVMLF